MRISPARSLFCAAAVLAATFGCPSANCLDTGGFAIFQCANLAYFAPPPVPVTFDAMDRPTNISIAFWQIGFGNNLPASNTGAGTSGTGNSGPSTFNGNDQGILGVNLKNAQIATGSAVVPAGATCISTANWADNGVDGCCDNPRTSLLLFARDGFLNGYFNWDWASSGYFGYYSLNWQQDYPMAVLLKAPATPYPCDTTPECDTVLRTCTAGPRAALACVAEADCDYCSLGPSFGAKCSADHQCADASKARWFALAAVATLDRGNDGSGTNGPCWTGVGPGTNPGPCDVRAGFYNLSDVRNGQQNLANPAAFNVVPWQAVPRPMGACISGCGDIAPLPTRTMIWTWNAVRWQNDGSRRPTTNPAMGGGACVEPGCGSGVSDATRAAGVGVVDLLTKANAANNWRGLVRYDLQKAIVGASNMDPNGFVNLASLTWSDVLTDIPNPAPDANGDPQSLVTANNVPAEPDSCWRLRTKFGKKPETNTTTTANCRVGKCGDRGYETVGSDFAAITCVGGALLGESIVNPAATKAKGKVTVSWETLAELTIREFKVWAVRSRGEALLTTVPCKECTSALGATYSVPAGGGDLKGAKQVRIEVVGDNPGSVLVPVQ